jgi:hypothetical protein
MAALSVGSPPEELAPEAPSDTGKTAGETGVPVRTNPLRPPGVEDDSPDERGGDASVLEDSNPRGCVLGELQGRGGGARCGPSETVVARPDPETTTPCGDDRSCLFGDVDDGRLLARQRYPGIRLRWWRIRERDSRGMMGGLILECSSARTPATTTPSTTLGQPEARIANGARASKRT